MHLHPFPIISERGRNVLFSVFLAGSMSCINVSVVDFWQENPGHGLIHCVGICVLERQNLCIKGRASFPAHPCHSAAHAAARVPSSSSSTQRSSLITLSHGVYSFPALPPTSFSPSLLSEWVNVAHLSESHLQDFFLIRWEHRGSDLFFFSFWLVIVNVPYLCFQIFTYHLGLY